MLPAKKREKYPTSQPLSTARANCRIGSALVTLLTFPPVNIGKTHNVVLAQVGPRLYFDKHQRNNTGIFEPMLCANGDIGRLVFCKQPHNIAVGNLCRAAHHNPVLGAVVVHLQ